MAKKKCPRSYLCNAAWYVQAHETRKGIRYMAFFPHNGKKEYLGTHWTVERAQEAQKRYAERNGLEWNISLNEAGAK